jgi:inositol phosphorylceramide mannosyltransferase catalytic subunit
LGAIPRLFHRVWLGGPEPDWLRSLADTWAAHPGWELRRWDDERVRELFPLHNQDVYDRAPELAPNHVGQLRSDVVRYELLHRFGGVYVDADFECLRPLDALLEGASCFAAWEVQDRWIANGLMGCERGHPFLARLVDGLAANVRREAGHKPNRMTGPRYLTATWRRYGRREVKVLAQRLVYPYSFAEIAVHGPGDAFPGAYTAHHWLNKRRERGVPCPS